MMRTLTFDCRWPIIGLRCPFPFGGIEQSNSADHGQVLVSSAHRRTLYQRVVCELHQTNGRSSKAPLSCVFAYVMVGGGYILSRVASQDSFPQAQNNGLLLYRTTDIGTDETDRQRNPGNGGMVDSQTRLRPGPQASGARHQSLYTNLSLGIKSSSNHLHVGSTRTRQASGRDFSKPNPSKMPREAVVCLGSI